MAAAQRIVIENCSIATVDANDTEYASGHVVIAGNRIEALGAGKAPAGLENVVRRIDATGQVGTADMVGPARERLGIVGVRHKERGEVPDIYSQLGHLRAGGGELGQELVLLGLPPVPPAAGSARQSRPTVPAVLPGPEQPHLTGRPRG